MMKVRPFSKVATPANLKSVKSKNSEVAHNQPLIVKITQYGQDKWISLNK